MGKTLLTSPTELKIVNVNPDTLYVNFKFVDAQGVPSGASLPEHLIAQLDDWQKAARADHEPVATSLTYSYQLDGVPARQTLMMRSHGSSMWSWLLFSEDIKELKFSLGTVNKGLFCQIRFSSHLLHMIGPVQALVEAEHMLYDFMGELFHAQMSEVHLCVDLQGFDFSTIQLVGEQLPFVSRVTNIRDRPVPPTEEEQEGGLSPAAMQKLEATIQQEIAMASQECFTPASLTTAHRRIATIDFGSHASDISAQIYNKTAEMKKHRKTYFEPIHRANGWDGESDIWRIEFRFRRAFLRDHELNEVYSVLECLRLLWRYATEHWLRFVDLDAVTGVNISRRPTHPVWEMVQRAYDDLEETALLSPAGEQDARLTHLIQTAPLHTLEYAVSLLTLDAQGEPMISQEEMRLFSCQYPMTFARLWLSVAFLRYGLEIQAKEKQTDLMNVVQHVRETYRDVAPEIVQEAVREELLNLSPAHLQEMINALSPQPYGEVRTSLVKRAKSMATMKACVAGALGYLRSAVALMPQDELPGSLGPNTPGSRTMPDLLSSLIWFHEKARAYDRERQRNHILEVLKKRVRYGFVTAQQVAEECALYGLDLTHEDQQAIERALGLLQMNHVNDRRSLDINESA